MTESIAMLMKMLRDAKAEPPLLINMDAAGEFTSAEFLTQLGQNKISYRLKKPGREQKNALAMVDTAIGKLFPYFAQVWLPIAYRIDMIA